MFSFDFTFYQSEYIPGFKQFPALCPYWAPHLHSTLYLTVLWAVCTLYQQVNKWKKLMLMKVFKNESVVYFLINYVKYVSFNPHGIRLCIQWTLSDSFHWGCHLKIKNQCFYSLTNETLVNFPSTWMSCTILRQSLKVILHLLQWAGQVCGSTLRPR